MRKIYFACFLAIFIVSSSFGNDPEEIGFLLFQPNLSNRFVNGEQANLELDNLANTILSKNLTSGQIYVHGYAAIAQNDIDPMELSQDRAKFIMQELETRGVSSFLFSNPVAFGSVNFWGDNSNEYNRQQNRRARVLIGIGIPPVPVTAEAPIIIPPVTDISVAEVVVQEVLTQTNRSQFNFPWRITLLILLIILIVILAILFGPSIIAAAIAVGPVIGAVIMGAGQAIIMAAAVIGPIFLFVGIGILKIVAGVLGAPLHILSMLTPKRRRSARSEREESFSSNNYQEKALVYSQLRMPEANKNTEGSNTSTNDHSEYTDDIKEPTNTGDLKPNTIYRQCETVAGGHKIWSKTDSEGRIVEVYSPKLIKNEGGRDKHSSPADLINTDPRLKGHERSDDEGGHIVSNSCGGSRYPDNIVFMSRNLNRGEGSPWREMERERDKLVEQGRVTHSLTKIVYAPGSRRPSKFIVSYHLDGEPYYSKSFDND